MEKNYASLFQICQFFRSFSKPSFQQRGLNFPEMKHATARIDFGLFCKPIYFFSLFFFIFFLPVFGAFAQAPTVPSSNFSVSNIDGSTFYVSFTPGDGQKRIIIASENPVTASPSNGVDYTPGNFGLGNEIAPGQFVVYDGSSSGVWIYGLSPATTYYLKIVEYNGVDFSTEYLTTTFLLGEGTTISGPTIQASNLQFSNVTGNSMSLSWTNGDGWGRTIIAKAGAEVNVEPEDLVNYSYSPNFGSGTDMGDGNFVVYSGTGTTVNLSNLATNTSYHFKIFEYKGNSGRVYLRPGFSGSQLTGSEPTIPASNFYTSNVDGNRFFYGFTAGNGTRRLVIAKAGSPVTFIPEDGQNYTSSTTFGSGQEVSAGEFVVYEGTSSGSWIYGLQTESTYYFSVFESNGTGAERDYLQNPYLTGSQSTISRPSVQISNLQFSNVTGNSMALSWTNGDGWGRIVIAKAGADVSVEPEDLINYGYSQNFGSGSNLGDGNYVVYNGSGSSTITSNLAPNTTYHFKIFEYSGSNGRLYLKPGISGSQTTASEPTVPASNFYTSNVDGNRFFYGFSAGNGTRRLVIAKLGSPVSFVPEDGQTYTASTTFGSGQEVSAGEFVVYEGTSSGSWIYGLQTESTYYFSVFESNGTGAERDYLQNPYLTGSQSTIKRPSLQVSNLQFYNVTGNSMGLSWTNGDGWGRIVIAKAGAEVSVDPVDLTNYSYSQNFGSGSNLGDGNYVVYNGSGSSTTTSNLDPNTTYHFKVFEYSGSNGRLYLKPGISGSQLTGSAPTVPASNFYTSNVDGDRFFYGFSAGNGTRRVVVAKAGSPVTFTPQDGQTYTGNTTFGSGQEVSTDEFVVYEGTGSGSWIYGLEPGTEYNFAIFEHNGNGQYYLIDPYLEAIQATLGTPTVQSSSAFTSSRSNTSINISWTKGNGANRVLIGRKDGPVNVEPADRTNYTSSSVFGQREIGTGNYVLYSSSGNAVNITNLEPGTNYHFALFEFNGSNAKMYLRPGYQFSLETYGERPTIQSSNANFSQVTNDSFTVDLTKGNGSGRIVLAKAGSPVDAGPSDFTSYNSNGHFAWGDEIGNGNFVIYQGSDETFLLEGLSAGTVYYLAFFEYAMSASGELYLAPAYTSSQETLAPVDLAITSFLNPQSNCSLSSAEVIEVEISNMTAYPVDYIKLAYTIDGGSPVIEELTQSNLIPANGTITYTFNQVADLSMDQVYPVEVYLMLEEDINPSNDAIQVDVENFPDLITSITPNTSINQGESLLLEASGGLSYLWSTGESSAQITVQPLESTTYSVLITGENGCQVERSVLVEVIPDPCFNVTCPIGYACYEGACFPVVVTVTGTVRDLDTGTSLENVAVSNGGNTVYTAPDGTYSIEAQVLTDLTFSLEGYQGQSIEVPDEPAPVIDVDLENPCYNLTCPDGSTCYLGACYPIIVTVTGTVRDASTTVPLENVAVSNGIDIVYTAVDGTYSIDAQVFSNLTFDLEGYQGQSIEVPNESNPIIDANLNIDACWGLSCPIGYSCFEGGCFPTFVIVSGTVRDSETSLPLENVAVSNDGETVYSGSDGTYSIETQVLTNLTYSLEGYQSQSIEVPDETSPVIDVDLENPCLNLSCPDGYSCYLGSCYPIVVTVTGTVRDAGLQTPLVDVAVSNGVDIVYTSNDGTYSIDAQVLTNLTFELGDYQSQSIEVPNESNPVVDADLISDACLGVTCPDGYSCWQGTCFANFVTVTGTIRDLDTQTPLENVAVSNGLDIVYSAPDGSYSIEAQVLSDLTFTLEGYQSQSLEVPNETDPVLDVDLKNPCFNLTCPEGYTCYEGSCFATFVTVTGTIRDADTAAPLENVIVRNGSITVYSASDGTYSIEAQVLTNLSFELDGYEAQSIEVPNELSAVIDVDLVNPCFNSNCPEGYVCYQGACFPEDDPCLNITCPDGYSCYQGACYATFVTVTGTVRDADSSNPLQNVAVSNGAETVYTSSEGTYSIEIQVLTNLSFELEGYETQSIQVPDQESPVIDVDLIANPCYNITCPEGYVCYQGSCFPVVDPCADLVCPEGYTCYEGSCFPIVVTVTGTVKDADSLTPLQGVAVGDGVTTVYTAPDGTYSFEAQVLGDLIFSLSSYHSQTIQIPNESNPVIDVDLLSLCSNLSCPEGYACYEGSCFPIACQSELGELTFSPALGDGETEFVFSITYTDPDEIALALGYPRLVLEETGTSGTIETSYVLEELDPSDENLADGKVYQILISDLNPASTFRAKVEASNLLACDQASDWIAGPTLSDSDIDLGIFANNISFSNENPNAFEPITIFARVRNYSSLPVENISVTAYDGENQIFSTVIPTMLGNATMDLSWPYSFETAGFYPIKVVIDEANEIQEINELNNFAIRPVLVGDYVLPGGMQVEASMNSYTVYPGQYVALSGLAQYFGIDEGVNPDVVGAAVEIQWANGTVNLTTRGDGSFSQSFRMPSVPGTYIFSGQVTDYTLTGEIAPMEVEVIPFPNKPDLIASIELDELEILQGQAVTGRATITNAGDATAYNFLFQWRNCEIQLGEELIGSLAPGESMSFEFSTQISSLGNCFNKNNCYFQAIADPGNLVAEKSKSNNNRIRYVTVYPNAPDLTVSQSYAPSSSRMEAPTQVYVRVDNIGGIAVTNSFTVNSYVDGILVDTRDFPGLEPCAKINYTLNLDFEVLEDHLVEIKVDEPIGSGQIAEHKEDNNEYSKVIRYVAPPVLYPNLNIQINDLTVNPISPLENQDFEIKAVFRNNGAAPVTEDIAVRWIINESGSETVIDDVWTGGLAVGETAQISAPANLNAYGNHFVRLQLDPANTIAESYETDNKAEMPLCIDFEAVQVGNVWNGGFFVNTQQFLTLKVRNKGLFTATNVHVAFELDGFQIAETTLPSVPPSYSGSGVSVSIPYVFTEPGTFVLKAIIDGEDQWIECNEGNNTWSKSITVKGPQPDLRILSEFISPTELNPEPDEQVQIFLSFENIGVVDAGPFKLRLLMDDQALGQDISVNGLGAGKISTVAIPTPYSSPTAGIKVMKGQVDPDQLANDVNYNNNEATRALVVGTAPNLYFENISFSYLCPEIGDEISIHVDIFNEGDLASNAELEFAYITDNEIIPIETKAIFVDLQSGISESINWTVVNPEYPIIARIKNSDPQEFNVLDNEIIGEIKDDIPPTLVTQNLELFLDESGLVNLVAEDFDNGSYDEGCGIETMTLDQNSLDCFVLDTWIPLQFTATDFAGNSSSQEVLVMVKDNILPSIENMPASIVVGNDLGNCTAIVSWIEPIALDNCSGSSIQQITGQPNGSAFGLGEHLILYQAVDASGNTIQNGFTITVSDTEAPSLTAPANIIVGTNPGLCEASNVDLGEAQSGDNCGGVQVTNDAPAIFPLGLTIVNWRAEDAAGNVSTAIQEVLVQDTEAPSLTAPANIIVGTDAGLCEASNVDLGEAQSGDNCGGVTVTNDAPAIFPLGLTIVNWRAEDEAGNVSTATQEVLVKDYILPTIENMPASIVVGNDPGNCTAIVSWIEPIALDNCSGSSIQQLTGQPNGSAFGLGEHLILYQAVDASGNTIQNGFTITVSDTEAPSLIAPANITIGTDPGLCEASNVDLGEAQSGDNCGGVQVTNDAPAVFPLGLTIVNWRAEDAAGNVSTATQEVLVQDTEAPSLIAPANIIVGTDAGLCEASNVDLGEAQSGDNCGGVQVSNDAPAIFPLGLTIVNWRAEDAAGNIRTAIQEVLVKDYILPTIENMPASIVVGNDPGNCTAIVSWIEPIALDNCSGSSIQQITGQPNGSAFGLGEHLILYQAVDASGNTIQNGFTITVSDTGAPSLIAPANITIGTNPGLCEASNVDLGEAQSGDNCGGVQVSNDAPAIFPLGLTIVNWRVEDAAGNVSTATQEVLVQDTEAPSLIAPANIIVGTDAGLCEAGNVDLGEAQSGDNCGGVQVTNDAPAIFPLGLTIVNWRAEDAAGNVSTATQEVWVEDREAPTVLTQNITLTIQEGEQVEVLPQSIDAGSTDNCGSLTLSLDKTIFTDLDEGENTVLLTAEDNAGNRSSATALVTIIVNWNPTCDIEAIANNISIELDRNGNANINPRDVDNGSYSTCARIVDQTLSQSSFSCADVGDNLVVFTITDRDGNQSEAVIIVTVIDPEAPSIPRTPKSITEAFTNGQIFEIPDYRIAYPATDNCSLAEFIQIPSPGTPLDAQGTYPIRLIARDTYGNESQAGFDLILSSSGGKGRGKNKFVRNESLIPVPWNTPEKEIASIGFERDNNGQKEELPVIWDLSTYNGLVPGTYEIHGQLQDEDPVLIWVKVAEKAMPEDILIVSDELTEAFFEGQILGSLITIDPEDDQHEYQLLDSDKLEINGDKVSWKGEEENAIYPLKFRVRSMDRAGQSIERELVLDRGLDRSNFEMYPNPASDFVQLQVNLTGPSHVSIQVYDLGGKVLIKDEGEYETGFNKSLELKSLASGTYLVQVQVNYQVEMKRLIIKK